MISEHTFIERYTSFWKGILPMGDAVLRELNRKIQRDKEAWHFCEAQREDSGPVRRDLISELGLRLLAARVRNGRIGKGRLPAVRVEEACREATELVGRRRGPAAPALPPPSQVEIEAAGELTRRLTDFLAMREPAAPVTVLPSFAGCGILAACQGDLLAGETLYEMKATQGLVKVRRQASVSGAPPGGRAVRPERPPRVASKTTPQSAVVTKPWPYETGFGLVDLRQLVVYGALNFAARRYSIRRFGLVNPRLGIFFRTDVEALVDVMAGRSSADLFSDILDFLSTERASA